MGKKMFVGGLPYEVDEAKLRELFAPYGKVVGAKVIMDRETGRSKGFGFVEMSTDDEAKAATDKLNNSALGERKIFVNEARPMEARPRPAFGAKPGGFGDRPSFGDKPSFGPPSFGENGKGGYGDRKRNFGPDKKSGGKKNYDKKGGFGEKKGGPLKGGFGGKKKDRHDDDGGW
ncbi:MAG: RNA recognition motif domain-containing protein [Elusimicrobiota bacterium]